MSIIVSNSEVDTYNTCERKWYYGFALGIRQKQHSQALSYGILGHKCLEEYYKALKAGESHLHAAAAGMQVVAQHIDTAIADDLYGEEGGIAQVVGERFMRYIEHYKDDGWRPLEVEGTFYYRGLTESVDYAMTCDLVVEATKGPFKGEVIAVDHKWCYNFWNDMELRLHPQLPKYIDTLRNSGYPIKRGIINQVRYRTIKNATPQQLLQRAVVVPSEKFIETVRHEEILAANQIEKLSRQGVAEAANMVRRKLQKRTCRECQYNLVCVMEANGSDPTPTIVANFEANTYGYRR